MRSSYWGRLSSVTLLFVFDMDDVLYDYDWRARMASLTEITGHDLHELRRRWWISGFETHAEAGRPDNGDDYLAAVTSVIGATITRDEWVDIRARATHPWADSIAAVQRATELGQVTLLTNNGALIGEELHRVAPELVPVMGRNHMFATAQYGARKPDPLVYQRVLERYGAEASSTFFTDDRTENIEGAESIGITGHLFQGASGLLEAIEAFAAEAQAA